MDKIDAFLKKVLEDYKCELLSVEQNIQRLQTQVSDDKRLIAEIEDSIDNSYDVISASGSANEDKRVEIRAVKELLDVHETELVQERTKKGKYKKDITNIKNLIKLYSSQCKISETLNRDEIVDKLDFISKLVKVDPFRAVEEIEQLKSRLR